MTKNRSLDAFGRFGGDGEAWGLPVRFSVQKTMIKVACVAELTNENLLFVRNSGQQAQNLPIPFRPEIAIN